MKTSRMLVVATVTLMLAGCGRSEPDSPQRETADLLFLRSGRGVTVVKAGAASPSFSDATAVPSGDWSTVVRSISYQGSYEGTTGVIAVNPSSGAERWERTVEGNLEVKLVSNEGDLVALGPAGERYYRDGRTRTKLVIAGSTIEEPQTIDLEGNFEPEAFSTDGGSLFVIKYLPARAPTRYQVRRLDLTTERVEGVYTPDAELQEAMGGTARIQTASPNGRRLYTLYTIGGGKAESRYAFVHVLSLDEQWAHCIDLPAEFASSAESATALTVAPDGERLYVANAAAGAVAEIDTEELEVVRTSPINFDSEGVTHAAHDSGSTLYLARGRRVAAVNASTLTERRSWSMSEKIKGVQVTNDARRIYVGLRDRVAILDAVTGERVDSIDPPGLKKIDQLGPAMRPVKEPRKDFVCAC